MRTTATLAAAAALALLAGCESREASVPIHASGHIEATEVRLAAKAAGRLVELRPREGDVVRTGEVVARFDTVDLSLELTRAEAELQRADAMLRLVLAGSRAEDVRQAREQLAAAGDELDAADRDLTRLEGLAARGTATLKARDDARTRRDKAQRGVAAAQATLDRVLAGPRPQEIEAASAQRDVAAAQVAVVRQRLADATVLAPSDGVITARSAEPGEVLGAGAPLAVLTDLARPWLTVYVDEPHLAQVRLGGRVEVRVDGRAQAFSGTVSYVSEVAEFTPKNVQTPEERAKLVFKVKIALDNSDGVFKPGMPADAYFKGTENRAQGTGAAGNNATSIPATQGRGEREEGRARVAAHVPVSRFLSPLPSSLPPSFRRS